MDPRCLRTFVEVVERRSFSAAARELGYTQSAVSQHIAALEADVGAPVLHRRPVGPTEVGARLLEHAGPILLRLDAARADVVRLVSAPPAALVIGVSPLAAPLVANALGAVWLEQPRLDVTVRVLGRSALVEEVATGALDLGVVDGVAAPSDPLRVAGSGPLSAEAVAEESLVVALPRAHPLARRDGLRLDGLADARWIEAPDAALPLSELTAATGSEGYRPALRYAGSDVRGLLAHVAAGHGLVVLPARTAEGVPGVAAVPVASPRLVHRTELVHGGAPGPAAAALVQALAA